jgi:hypothetical protein
MTTDWLREYKRECLLDEHRSLSSFVEREITMTTLTKLVAVAAWLGAATSTRDGACAFARGWTNCLARPKRSWRRGRRRPIPSTGSHATRRSLR